MEVEDVHHWMLRCPAWDHHISLQLVSHIWMVSKDSLDKQAAFVIFVVCTNHNTLVQCGADYI